MGRAYNRKGHGDTRGLSLYSQLETVKPLSILGMTRSQLAVVRPLTEDTHDRLKSKVDEVICQLAVREISRAPLTGLLLAEPYPEKAQVVRRHQIGALVTSLAATLPDTARDEIELGTYLHLRPVTNKGTLVGVKTSAKALTVEQEAVRSTMEAHDLLSVGQYRSNAMNILLSLVSRPDPAVVPEQLRERVACGPVHVLYYDPTMNKATFMPVFGQE